MSVDLTSRPVVYDVVLFADYDEERHVNSRVWIITCRSFLAFLLALLEQGLVLEATTEQLQGRVNGYYLPLEWIVEVVEPRQDVLRHVGFLLLDFGAHRVAIHHVPGFQVW